MDPFKPHPNAPDNLEKGCPEAQPLDSEARSVPPARTRDGRFFVKHPWIVFGTVALTWLVFTCGKRAFSRLHHVWQWAGENVNYTLSEEGDAGQCVNRANWTTHYDRPPWAPEYPYGAETAFSLPVDSDTLYLISRGRFQHGLVNIEQSSEVTDTVDVRVQVAYHNDEALGRATVCQMERGDREYGVGILTHLIKPHRLSCASIGQLKFDVTLTLPAANEAPLSVKKLETKMPGYSQNVADLQKSVVFDRISLASANGRLSVQSVACVAGQFSSLNGDIDGHFFAQSILHLNTVNGRITPTVSLLHRENGDSPKFTVHAGNGQLDAKVSLTSEALVGGEFEVDAKSINGNIGLNFTHTPVDSVLFCSAETTVGGVEVELDSAFEGTYSLQSLLGKKLVEQRDVEDPSGRGRQRVMSLNETIGRVEGELKWVESDGSSSEDGGYVVLKALTSSVKLIV